MTSKILSRSRSIIPWNWDPERYDLSKAIQVPHGRTLLLQFQTQNSFMLYQSPPNTSSSLKYFKDIFPSESQYLLHASQDFTSVVTGPLWKWKPNNNNLCKEYTGVTMESPLNTLNDFTKIWSVKLKKKPLKALYYLVGEKFLL